MLLLVSVAIKHVKLYQINFLSSYTNLYFIHRNLKVSCYRKGWGAGGRRGRRTERGQCNSAGHAVPTVHHIMPTIIVFYIYCENLSQAFFKSFLCSFCSGNSVRAVLMLWYPVWIKCIPQILYMI